MTMIRLMRVKRATLFFLLIAVSAPAGAAEVKAFFPGAMRPAVEELLPQFEQASGHKVTVIYGPVGGILDRLKKGETADLVVVSDERLADLITQGKVMTERHATVALMGIGVFMRKGAVKPDISSADAFKRALLSAKSIVYKDPAVGDSSAIFASGLIERLGIAAEMKPKTKVVAPVDNIDTVVKGDAEIGFDQMSNVVADARVEPIGTLPPDIQHYTNYAAGVAVDSKQQEAAIALIDFLRLRTSQAVMQKKGFTSL
jgi:molybdate transport system substrate-binding protein